MPGHEMPGHEKIVNHGAEGVVSLQAGLQGAGVRLQGETSGPRTRAARVPGGRVPVTYDETRGPEEGAQ
jgi:hypothetical protein